MAAAHDDPPSEKKNKKEEKKERMGLLRSRGNLHSSPAGVRRARTSSFNMAEGDSTRTQQY